MRIDENNAVETIPHQERREILNAIPTLPDDDYYAKTAKWLASDQDTRLITPFSKMNRETWVQNRLIENTVGSLEEALAIDPNNSEVALALAKALLDSSTGDRETNLGQAAILANQAIDSSGHEVLLADIQSAQVAFAFDQRVARLEEEAMASADIGETTSLAALHKTLILANLLAQSDNRLKLTTELRSPQELINIEFQDFEPQVFVAKESEWHYLDNNQPPPPNWISPEFNHDSWQSGPAPLGYGEDQTTTLKGEGTRATGFYFRHRFDHQKHSTLTSPSLSIRCDDGAVVYLNGEEILRFRMPEGPISHETEASEMASNAAGSNHEIQWHHFVIKPDLLREKNNLLAVEIHQKHTTQSPSSDLYLALEFAYRHSEDSYFEQFDTETLTRALSQLTLALPPELAPRYQERWQSAILPGILSDDRETLDLRAKFLKRLHRHEEALAALEKLLEITPPSTNYDEFIIHISCLRGISQCLQVLGRQEESLAFRARIDSTIPPRPENLFPSMLDLTEHFNRNFFNTHTPPYWGSWGYWAQRIPKIFDPGEGPDFDVRAVIQLKDDDPESSDPERVKIKVGQTFGAIHFLQSAQQLREHVGTEIAHYLIHYEDGTPARIPLIAGEGVMHEHFNGIHGLFLSNVRHLALSQQFRWRKRGPDSGKLGVFRQSWTNPDPDKRVTHLEFVSAQKRAIPQLLAVTLEPKDQVAERIKDLPQKLQPLEEQLQSIPDLNEPVYIRQRRNLLREIVPLLGELGHHERARQFTDELFSIPPRPEGLSSKQIDLTEVYTESFFLPGINLGKHHRNFKWNRMPEGLQTIDHLTFDVRGAIQLNSGTFPEGSGRYGKDLNRYWPNPCPDQVTIPIRQRFQHIHFLQTCRYHDVDPGTKVADYVIHYDDGSTETIPVVFHENIFDNTNARLNNVTLASDTKAVAVPWIGGNGREQRTMFALQTWENPHPDKRVTHIDFISAKQGTGPFLAGITVE